MPYDHKPYLRRYYQKNRERLLAQQKAYRLAHPKPKSTRVLLTEEEKKKRKNERSKKYYAANKERCQERNNQNSLARYYRNKQKVRARGTIHDAKRRGKLSPSPACMSCGKICKTEAHHHNGYSKEATLDVIWLCKECHRAILL